MALEQFRPVSNGVYYLSEPTLNVPRFEGNGAKLLGIQGEAITPATFLNLFDGYLLNGDEAIKLPNYMHPDRRGAFEMTANLPKCASIIDLIGKDTRIDEVMDRASRAVARAVEKDARVKTTKKSETVKWRKPDNLVWVAFDHAASRSGDPHRHRHLVFMNLSHDREAKSWKAIELYHVDQPALGELFRKEMMKGLRQLGYKVKASGKEYEIVGFPAEIKGKFSSRNGQIKEIEAGYDERARQAGNKPMSQKERSKLSLYQRPEKDVQPFEDRFKQWVSDLTKEQLGLVKSFVRKAKDALAFDQWRGSLNRFASKLRTNEREEREVEHAR